MYSLARSLLLTFALVGGVTACSPENAQTQFERGVAYVNGEGVQKDAAQGVAWIRKAAEQGLAQAQFNLGVFYYSGQGVPQDSAQALVWYRKAAEQGYANAQFNLGWM